jgi:ribosomal protein S18 acetylase RimI-like enzyme
VADLRELGPDDWQAWRELRLRALAEAPYAFGSTLVDWQGAGDAEHRWRDRLASVPLNLLAQVADRPAGMVSATAPDDDASVELISMWVAPEARGRGVGDALVGAVLRWAGEQGAGRVTLWVAEGNDAAVGLYRRHGFAASGRTQPMDEHGSRHERQMVRRLGPEPPPGPVLPAP